jgi:hypothetical protein
VLDWAEEGDGEEDDVDSNQTYRPNVVCRTCKLAEGLKIIHTHII